MKQQIHFYLTIPLLSVILISNIICFYLGRSFFSTAQIIIAFIIIYVIATILVLLIIKAAHQKIIFAELKKLEQIRSDFVSNITHELRTPLTSIRGYIETLQCGAIENAEIRDKFLQIIEIEADRLYSLINDILELSEIEQLGNEINSQEFNITELVNEIITLLSKYAEKQEIKLENLTTTPLFITANRNRIKQLLINIIDNGIKYGVKGGFVSISTIIENGQLKISVTDNGIGIPQIEIERIFERFYRVDKGRSREIGGTGLGLSIVKHIVSLYNGTIDVSSELNKGSQFNVFLKI